ncbi:MAG TPA: C69 family dipeptidase [Deltaproteobacteria bacterium]|nr:C69 family dipeptidase [Deltaproteobacteria bacterium]
MCDTFAVGPSVTKDGTTIFAKNSDREPDEAHIVTLAPRAEHRAGETLRCTYIEIPQARRTHAVVLAKPAWIWGAEMGVNEKGVVIGNEALFMKQKPERTPGLIGMDLVRLGLERASSARQACEVIVDLLARYGQGGACGYRDKSFVYMNSFLVADRGELLVLETIGRDYAVRPARDHAVISNAPSIASNWELSSLRPGTDLVKARDPLVTFFAGSARRKALNEQGIRRAWGRFTVETAFALLRSHAPGRPWPGFNADVCMHAADPLIRRSQTTGSLVVELHPQDRFRIFVTATSAPCLSPFKPFLPAAPYEEASRAGAVYTPGSFWWEHEVLHLSAMLRPHTFRESITREVEALEGSWTGEYPAHGWDEATDDLVRVSHGAFEEAKKARSRWVSRLEGVKACPFGMRGFYLRRVARRNRVPLRV